MSITVSNDRGCGKSDNRYFLLIYFLRLTNLYCRCSVLFCSSLHIVAGCGAIGEHMAAPAAEPESYIRLCHLGSLVLQGTHPSEVLSNGIDLAPTRTEFRREYLHFSELSYTTHKLVSFQHR